MFILSAFLFVLASSLNVNEFNTKSAVLAPRFTEKRDQNGPQIWDLDEDSNVLAVNCSNDFSELVIFHSGNHQWRSNDVLSGSFSWGCLKNGRPHSILVEILHQTATENLTTLKCKELQLTDVFQDLSLTIRSTNRPGDTQKRLEESQYKVTTTQIIPPKGFYFLH